MSEKKYSPKEAAIAVLNRAAELYKNSNLAKSEDLKKGDWKKIHDKLEREGYSKESADKIDGSIKAKLGKGELKKDGQTLGAAIGFPGAPPTAPSPTPMGKSDEMQKMGMSEENPDEKADADLGEKVEREVEQHEEQNEDPKHEMKGHIKLAKFMGRMEHKRGQKAKEMDKGETGHERGVHTQAGSRTPGMSEAGMYNKASKTKAGENRPAVLQNVEGYKNKVKGAHEQVLDQIHQMSKPKLPG
jgi:hypothetical protein